MRPLVAAGNARAGRASTRRTCSPGTATRWLSGPVDAPAPLDVHLVRGGRLTFILRRSQLQQFIHATPSDRYRGLADLIGVETLDRIELGLKRARDTLQ